MGRATLPSTAELATRLRLGSGLVLAAFLACHLLNHALGVGSLGLMQDGRVLFAAVWRSAPGTIALYGALVLHLVLVLVRIWSLRTFRLPPWQVAQIVLGLVIPFLLIGHVIGTRVAHEVFDLRDDYVAVLRVLWPELAVRQTTLVVLAWLHGMVGLYFWLRLKPGFRKARFIFLAIALVLPVLSLLGFALAGREVEMVDREGYGALAGRTGPEPVAAATSARLQQWRSTAELTFFGLVLVAVSGPVVRQLRARHRSVLSIRYPNGSVVPIDPGMTVLEASQAAGIPHASVCGGRGRCSTCRVRVTGDLDRLPDPAADEARVLRRIGAGSDVRLACQLRPPVPISVVPLLPAQIGAAEVLAPLDPGQGMEREVAILFADLRAFTRMAEGRLPYDVVFILNQYFAVTGSAIEAAGGKVDKFIGDGVMALFGTTGDGGGACRDALNAARGIALGLAALNRRLEHDRLAEPLRIAMGLHAGPVILGSMGYGRTTSLTAIGDAVNVASRLEAMAKDLDVQLVVSDTVTAQAGLDLGAEEQREIEIRGRRGPLMVRLVGDAAVLPASSARSPAGSPARSLLSRLRPATPA